MLTIDSVNYTAFYKARTWQKNSVEWRCYDDDDDDDGVFT